MILETKFSPILNFVTSNRGLEQLLTHEKSKFENFRATAVQLFESMEQDIEIMRAKLEATLEQNEIQAKESETLRASMQYVLFSKPSLQTTQKKRNSFSHSILNC